MLKIYGRVNSINVRKVLWAAAELGLDYTQEDWGRGFRGTDEPEFKAVSGFGVIPVIDDDGFILRESNTIVRYLIAKENRTDLLPADVKARATVEAWMDWAGSDLSQEVRIVAQTLLFKMPNFDDPKYLEPAIAAWTRQMGFLDAHLAGGSPYVAGDAFTAADIPVGLFTNRWFMTPIERPDFQHVHAYYERLKERAAFREHGANGTP
ncbi:MAG: glutathione S-transferase family protein [Pseudomonadota bacterium]